MAFAPPSELAPFARVGPYRHRWRHGDLLSWDSSA